MPIEILMPALSPTMEEGNLAKWVKKEGDKVAPGDVIAEIETVRATMEVEAVDEGILGKILVAEGTEGVKVNTPIAVLVQEGESADDLPAAAPAAKADADTPAATADDAGGKAREAAAEPTASRAATVPAAPRSAGAADPDIPARPETGSMPVREAAGAARAAATG